MARKVKSEREPSIVSKVLVKDIMNSPVITASPDENVKELADKMDKNKVGSVVIVENGKPLGVVSEFDVVTKVSVKDELPSKVPAKDVMQPLHTIEADKPLTDAARLLRKLDTKRLGVMYENKLAGIISASDVIAVSPDLVYIISQKASIIKDERTRSPTNISGYCDECDEWSDYLQFTDGRFICDECRISNVPGEVPPEAM
jgi:CBS domain-containing protein